MNTYQVNCSIPVHLTITVEAANKEDALDLAMERAHLTGYCGNGAISGKLIGTSDSAVYLDPGEEILEGHGWEITVEEV